MFGTKHLLMLPLLCCLSLLPLRATTGTGDNPLSSMLRQAGFADVRVLEEDSVVYISCGNRAYRWNVEAVVRILDAATNSCSSNREVQLVLTENDVPQAIVKIREEDWRRFRSGRMTKERYDRAVEISYRTDTARKKLSALTAGNPSAGNVDIVLYPQIKLMNIYIDQIVDAEINFAPAVNMYLWRGVKLTSQWIVPLIWSTRSFGQQSRYVRPGFNTVTWQINPTQGVYTTLTAGVFNRQTAGIHWSVSWYPLPAFSLSGAAARTATTDFAHHSPRDWSISKPDNLFLTLKAGYFYSPLSLQTDVTWWRMSEGGNRVRADVTRLFGQTSIGFYGIAGKGFKDAGFHLTVPLPGKKRSGKGKFRVTVPRYFDWEYATSSKIDSGAAFEVRPDENRAEHFYNPLYLKAQLYTFNH